MRIKEFLIERYFAKYEFSTPYILCGSDAESFTTEEILTMGGNYTSTREHYLNLGLAYTESTGHPELRSEISKFYSNLQPDQILVFSGAEEGIFSFVNTVTQPSDHIIVQFPAYQSLFEVANSQEIEVTYWKMREQDKWKPDLDELPSLMKPNTKAIIINSPHNPTGYHFSKDEYQKIIDFARENNLYLFSDEVYRLGEYDDEFRLPPAADLYDKAVSLGVMSKPLGLPGLRIGWIATQSREVMKQLMIFKDYTTICNSAPAEYLATHALRHYTDILERNMGIIKSNLVRLREFMIKYKDLFEWIEPTAGTIAFIRVKFTDDVEDFCRDLIEKKGVLLLPSTAYHFGFKYFRIGFGRKNFEEALQLLIEYLEEEIV